MAVRDKGLIGNCQFENKCDINFQKQVIFVIKRNGFLAS